VNRRPDGDHVIAGRRLRARPAVRPVSRAADGAATGFTIDDIPDAVFATDLDDRITHWADSAQALFGFTADEAVGVRVGDLLPSGMRHAHDEVDVAATVHTGRTWRGEATVRLRDGAQAWIESSVKPRRVAGEIVGSVSVSRDVTETVEAELRQTEERRFANAVLETATSLVLVLDTAGRVVLFNPACERLSGYTAAEMIGQPIWERLIPSDQRSRVFGLFATLRLGAVARDYENHWVRRDGGRRLISWSSSFLVDDAGVVTHVIATGVDVTERRRADDALAGIAAVGHVLATHGLADASLDAVIGVLAEHLGYREVALLVADGDRLRVGAARGSHGLPSSFPLDRAIVGRVFRTGEAEWVRDGEPDPADPEQRRRIRSEIAAPLRADGQILGVLDIEAPVDSPFSECDFRLAKTVAERVASAVLLGRERHALAERARLFAALNEFAQAATATLDPEQLLPALIAALARIFPGDVMTLTTLDRASGRYRLSAALGVPESVIGLEVRPGSGATGLAIERRAFVGPVLLQRADYVEPLRDAIPLDVLISVAVPLIHEDLVLGVISVGRANLDHPFSDVECEVMQMLGSQAALALANASLHEEVSELAIHDGLTDLFNRRYFDVNLELMLARWRRVGNEHGLAAIMFDLDHFGRFNKEHGHQAGDAVLRAFAGILHERLRSSDLVARYGGEEFVVVLEDCTLEDAVRVAEEVRSTLEARVVDGPGGQQLRALVSAGCASIDPAEPNAEALLRTADVALAMAKRAGRNQVVAA
jgi:diguanylate cyclase (GGDEF)-like protein/PAS domain S-box-containing protein